MFIVLLLSVLRVLNLRGRVPACNYFKGDTNMRWAVESELPRGMVVLCLFNAEDEREAQEHISAMREAGHTNIFNLKSLPEDVTTEDLKRLFPCQSS
jgi:hypothetical protein